MTKQSSTVWGAHATECVVSGLRVLQVQGQVSAGLVSPKACLLGLKSGVCFTLNSESQFG